MRKKEINIYGVQELYVSEILFIADGIKTGFPNPAQDYLQESIDMNRVIAPKPNNTFVIVAERGISDGNIEEGNLLVIDQSLLPNDNDIIAYIKDGEFLIRKIRNNDKNNLVVLGVVTANIKTYKEHFHHNIESLPVLAGEYPDLPSFVQKQIVGKIDFNQLLFKNSSTTFVTVAVGDSMIEDGIEDSNLLIIDKSITPYDQCLAACYINGEFTLKRVKVENESAWLLPSNPAYSPIELSEVDDFLVWGIVVSNIKQFHYRRLNGRASRYAKFYITISM